LSLTKSQAVVLKWLYALYTYFIVAATVAGPVRVYIGRQALHGREPIGWALGYLLGDLPSFRLRTLLWNLEHWIALPPRQEATPLGSLGLADRVRLVSLGAANSRLLISAYCLVSIGTGLVTVQRLSATVEVDTRRKVFHGIMVSMFLPTIFLDPAFAALALALTLTIFLLLDLFRASQLPPVSQPLTHFLAPYVDGRDHRGPIIISHIFLLIGCAIPLWLSLGATARAGTGPAEGWEVGARDLGMVSGVVCVGMGDAAASLVGRRHGRRRLPWSGGKSVEGSVAFAAAVVLGLVAARLWLVAGGWPGGSADGWAVGVAKAAVAAVGASLTEAVLTGGNDNVVVPVVLWLFVRGLGI
jgi:dolichol kinase